MKHFRQHRLVVFGIWVYALSILTLLCLPTAVLAANSPTDIFEQINATRERQLLNPLVTDTALTEIAEDRLADIQAFGDLSHMDSSGRMVWDTAEEQGYDYVMIGENLAEGYGTPSEITSAWMKSANHRANILNPSYSQTGIAVGNGSRGQIIVQLFAQIPDQPPNVDFQKNSEDTEPDGVSIISKYPPIEHDSIVRLGDQETPVDISIIVRNNFTISGFSLSPAE